MKRKKLITKKLTKVVAFAMAAILAMTPMAAQAGEITERTGIFGTDISEYVDSDDYSNSEEEAQTVHDNSEDVAKYESAAAAAETAAVQASEAVDELETQIAIAETEIAKANEAVASVETEATNVSNAATTVSNETTKVGNTTRDVLDHNNKVDVAQDLIERATEEVNAATQVEVEDETEETLVDESIAGESIPAEIGESLAEETIEGETGTEEGTEETVETVDLVTYTADQAAKAQQAAADAETALRNAIAVDTTDINNDEVAGYVQDAQDAADAAADAADAAEDAIDDAVRELLTTIEAYNAAAEDIGLSTISYDFEKGAFVLKDGTLVTKVADLVTALQSAQTTSTEVTTAANTVVTAATNVETATANYDAAVSAYETAEKAANEAAQTVFTKVTEAEDKADIAIMDEVNKAQAVVDEKQATATDAQAAVDNATAAQTTAKSTLDSANATLATATTNYNNAVSAKAQELYSNALASYQNSYDAAVNEWKSANIWKKTYYWTVVLAKQAALENFKFWNSADSYKSQAKSALSGSDVANAFSSASASQQTAQQTYNEATTTLNNASSALSTANSELSSANSELAAAQVAQQKLYNEIKAAYDADKEASTEAAKEALVAQIEALIDEYATDIDQAQYDQAVNTWANTVFTDGWWRFFSKGSLRDELDDLYDEEYNNLWKDLGDDLKDTVNLLGITQWMVSTDEVDTLIDNCIELAKVSIEEQYKEAAIVDATYAKLTAQDTLQDAVDANEIKLTTKDGVTTASAIIDGTIQSMDAATTSYNNAVNTYTAAKTAYDSAVAAANQITGVKSVTGLEELLAAVNAAKEAIDDAYDNLVIAEIAAEDAENLARWATAMTTEQEMTVVSGTEEEPVETVVEVPYTIYRAYVESQTIALIDETAKAGTEERYENVTCVDEKEGTSTELNAANRGIVYWALDEDGNFVVDENGNPVIYYADANGNAPANMPNGTYFVGTIFGVVEEEEPEEEIRPMLMLMAREVPDGIRIDDGIRFNRADSYMMTGYSFNYVKPSTSSNTSTGESSSQPAAAAEQGEVLGVSRETAEVTPVDNEGAVLGETRNPQTSDHSNAGLWLSLMAASAACIAVLSKKKENDER